MSILTGGLSDGLYRSINRRNFLRGLGAAGVGIAASRLALANEAPTYVSSFQPVRFAVIGDWGCGYDGQFAIAERMAAAHASEPFEFVLSVGDNIYPNGNYEDFGEKFERPYEPFLKTSIPFHTVFGNHDVRDGREAQLRYPLFGMNGRPYYTMQKGNGLVDFFLLDTTAMDDRQIAWLDRSLAASTAVWKVAIFHHPIYSSGKAHGSDMGLRKKVEPLFRKHGVQVGFSGDDHIYQRVTLQHGIQYFVTGAAGKLREGDIKRDNLVALGYDVDNHFMVVEADTSKLAFKAINSKGEVIDQGAIAAPAERVASFLNRFRAA